MGVTLPKDMRFAGFRPSAIKAGLQSIWKTGSAEAFAQLKGAGANVRERAILFEELLDRDLIEKSRRGYQLTKGGEAIAVGKARTRTPIARARMHIDNLLERINAYNSDPDGFLFIDQVWLFGSAMRGEDTVGDVDIALSTSRRPPYDKSYYLMQERVEEVLQKRGEIPAQHGSLLFSGEEWLMKKAIFGERRHPLLSGVQTGTGDLESIGAPCQLIYDRSRGRVNDPILPQHPKSEGRAEGTPAPRQLPDLSPDPVRPMHARWLYSYDGPERVSPYDIFGNWEIAEPLFPSFPDGLKVMLAGDGSDAEWTPKALNKKVDGRDRVLLKVERLGAGTSVVLHRSIVDGDDGVRVIARLERAQMVGTSNPAPVLFDDISRTIALLLATDAQRVMRRQMDIGEPKEVAIIVDSSSLKDPLSDRLGDDAFGHLEARRVSIEPDNWTGSPVRIEMIDPALVAPAPSM
jgi:predicted nucleotidyltransferase